jgi:hypothetical protein
LAVAQYVGVPGGIYLLFKIVTMKEQAQGEFVNRVGLAKGHCLSG